MHRVAELLRGRLRRIIARRLLVARLVSVGAPVALVGASLGIEHDHPAIAVAVGGEHLLGGDVDRDVGRRAEPLGRVAVVALPLLADLQHELAVHGELEQLPVLLAVAGEPDEIVVVDEDTVLALGPLVARARAAPVTDQVAGLVEQQHRRRGDAAPGLGRILLGGALARRERARPMHHPDAVIFVGGEAGDLSEDPVVRQGLGPERVDLELRRRACSLGQRLPAAEHHRNAEPRD